MKRRNYIAFLSAAVTAVAVSGSQKASADILQWDASGNSAPSYTDGGGTWDTSSTDWVDNVTSTNVAWTNTSPANSAVFGNPSPTAAVNGSATPVEVDLGANITVQDITLGMSSTGAPYQSITDADGGSLTVNGNITKTAPTGADQFFMLFSNLTLGAGNHTIAANDTPGSAHPEIEFDTDIAGPGNIIIDNGSYAQWGVTAFTEDNDYTGTTTINKGELVITSNNALGSTSAGTTIANQGVLSIGGNGTNFVSGITVNEPITITRNTYTGTDYSDYPDAIISANTGQSANVNTFAGPITIDSTDARIAANTSIIVIPGSLIAGTDVAAGAAVADFDGDFAGSVVLSGDNTAFGAAGDAIEIINGVELTAANDAALGGAGSKLILNGGEIHITSALLASNPAFATNFGGHTIVNGTVGTGVDVDQGLTFTVNGLTGGGVGMRGGGTLDFTGTNTFTGTNYYDGVDDGPNEGTENDTTATGIVNFMAGSTTTEKGLRIRSATVNVAGTLNVGGAFTSIGADSTGSNGTPDYGTVNITGNGQLIENSGDDFNISDNSNTHGTINIYDNGQLTTGGITYVGKSTGAVGTINQYGGTITINRNGNFGFDIGDGRNGTPTGYYNLYAGTITSAGETYVGEGAGGTGYWTQSGGTANINNWFVVGREGSVGYVDISGGILNHSGGNMSLGDSVSSAGKTDMIKVHGSAVINDNSGDFYVGNNGANAEMDESDSASIIDSSGQFWIGNGSPGNGLVNISGTASITVNNWFAIGRSGGTGTLNINGGTVTQQASNWFTIGSGGTGTVNVNGGTLNALQAYIGETGGTTGTLNINSGSVNLTNNSIISNASSVAGTLNLNGGTLTAFGFQAQNGGGMGAAKFYFNGGTLKANANNTLALTNNATTFIGGKVTSVVSTGGAIVNTNGFTDQIASALTHDSTLSGADGGLTKQGAGTLILSGAETYTGPTTISAGTLQYIGNNNETLSSLSIANGAALDLSGGQKITVTTGFSGYLAAIQAAYDKGAWDGTSATAPIITSAYAATNHAVGIGYGTSGGALTLRLTYLGDADLDGAVTNADILAMTPMPSGGTWATGDFNYDGAVNADDFALAQLGIVESGGGNITTAVPEPASMALLLLPALLGFAPRRTRKRCN